MNSLSTNFFCSDYGILALSWLLTLHNHFILVLFLIVCYHFILWLFRFVTTWSLYRFILLPFHFRSHTVTMDAEQGCLYCQTIVQQRWNVTFLFTPTVSIYVHVSICFEKMSFPVITLMGSFFYYSHCFCYVVARCWSRTHFGGPTNITTPSCRISIPTGWTWSWHVAELKVPWTHRFQGNLLFHVGESSCSAWWALLYVGSSVNIFSIVSGLLLVMWLVMWRVTWWL